jgi:large subunit ribosomal protein L7/L12
VIKEIRSFTDLGLKEAKELVDKAPAVIKGGVSKEDAEAIVERRKAVGAKVVMG